MFDKILIPTDLTAAAFTVVKNLGGLKALGAGECLLLECLGLKDAGTVALSNSLTAIDRTLQEQRKILEEEGFRVEIRIIPGSPQKEICRIADEEDFSMIAIGAQVSSLTAEALMGGMAYEIIHHCCRPVLMIRLEETERSGIRSVDAVRPDYNKHILFPTDFSAAADQAFEVVKHLAKAGARKVTLMHVQEKTRIEPYLVDKLEEFNRIDTDRLQDMKEVLQSESGVETDIVIPYGNASKEIIDFVKQQPVRLVVMGSQGRGYVKELFLGSVSHNVSRQAASSVLLVPAKRGQ